MFEPDIARKCIGALVGVAALVCASVLASWWASASGSEPAPALSVASAPRSLSVAPPEPPVAARRPGPFLAPNPAAAAADPAEKNLLERKAFQLEMENARLRGRLDDMLNWILENVRGTFPLPESQMANLRLVPVDKDLAVSDDLAQLLRLNEEEVGRLDTVFLDTKSVLQALEAANISVAERAENQVVLNIPPYSAEGQAVRQELYGELQRTLGAARFDRFLQVAAAGLEETFDYFGDADRTLEFEALQDAESGGAQLFVRDERVRPSKDDPLRLDITASERIVDELPDEYYAYWNWLPDYVTRFARNN